MRSFLVAKAATIATIVALATAGAARAAGPAPITIVVFTPPSLGAVFPDVIKQQKFDIENGVDITFVERPPDAYAAQFNSGEFQVGGSASVLILGLGATRGVKTSYLFNLFDFWGTVVTQPARDQDARRPQGQAARRRQGHDQLHDVRLVREAAGRRSGLVPGGEHGDAWPGRLCGGRARRRGAALGAGLYAGQSQRCRRSTPSISTSPRCGRISPAAARMPYLGVAAHQEWIDAHRDLRAAALSRLQAGGRLGHGQSGRGRAAGRVAEERRRARGDHRFDQGQFAARARTSRRPARSPSRSRRPTKPGSMSACSRTMPPDSSIYGGEMN